MANIKIPGSKGWRQLGMGDLYGELWATRNVNTFTSPGKLKLSRPMTQVATDTELSSDKIQAFCMYSGQPYALTNDDLYDGTSDYSSWNDISQTEAPITGAQDMVVFDDEIVITTDNDLDAYDGTEYGYTEDWWTSAGGTALINSDLADSNFFLPKVLHADSRIKRIFVTDGPRVRGYAGDISGGGTFTVVNLPEQYVATCIQTGIRKVWIGTYSESNEQTYVFEWDGGSTDATDAYPIGARSVLAMEMVDNSPVILTERGEIKQFNGAGFTTIGQFPFTEKELSPDGVEVTGIQRANTARPVHPKGMKRVGNNLYIYAMWNSQENSSLPMDEQTPSGLWVFNLTTRSLTHVGAINGEFSTGCASPIMVVDDVESQVILGGQDMSTNVGIWLRDNSGTTNYGYFVTPEMQSASVQDAWDNVYIKGLLGSTDEVVVKYRTEHNTEYPLVVEDVAWASTTQFNTTDDLSAVSVGDEVEILKGQSAGRLVHVTAISESASTYSVTVDTALGSAGETSDVRFDNWKKIDNTFTSADGETKQLGTDAVGSWVQYKVELRGADGLPEIRQLLMHSNNKQSA